MTDLRSDDDSGRWVTPDEINTALNKAKALIELHREAGDTPNDVALMLICGLVIMEKMAGERPAADSALRIANDFKEIYRLTTPQPN